MSPEGRQLRTLSGAAASFGASGIISHGAAVAGAGGTTAGDTSLGTITLPAGGEWLIYGAYCQAVAQTRTAAEKRGGYLKLVALDGDVQPNPSPFRVSSGLTGSYLGATANVGIAPLRVQRCAFKAPGKTRIELIYNNTITQTVADQVVAGLLFGPYEPELLPMNFIDIARAAVTAAVDTAVATVTLAEKAKRIIGVAGVLAQNGVLTTAEELLGFFRLSSDDINLAPSQYPFNAAFGAGLGGLIGNDYAPPLVWIPVDIPTPGGARVDVFVDLNTAVTNAAEVEVYIAYE